MVIVLYRSKSVESAIQNNNSEEICEESFFGSAGAGEKNILSYAYDHRGKVPSGKTDVSGMFPYCMVFKTHPDGGAFS